MFGFLKDYEYDPLKMVLYWIGSIVLSISIGVAVWSLLGLWQGGIWGQLYVLVTFGTTLVYAVHTNNVDPATDFLGGTLIVIWIVTQVVGIIAGFVSGGQGLFCVGAAVSTFVLTVAFFLGVEPLRSDWEASKWGAG